VNGKTTYNRVTRVDGNKFVVVSFFAEMEVWSYGVFYQVNDGVAAKHERRGPPQRPGRSDAKTLRDHFKEGGSYHETRAQRDEIAKVALLPVAANQQQPAENISERGDRSEDQGEIERRRT
jgi:hypothetical protein